MASKKALSIIRRSKQYKMLRFAVFRRDKYSCKLCGRKGKLEMHHITRFYDELNMVSFGKMKKQEILDYVRKNTFALNARNNVTVCTGCHHFITGYEGYWANFFMLLTKRTSQQERTEEFQKLLKILPLSLTRSKKFRTLKDIWLK